MFNVRLKPSVGHFKDPFAPKVVSKHIFRRHSWIQTRVDKLNYKSMTDSLHDFHDELICQYAL